MTDLDGDRSLNRVELRLAVEIMSARRAFSRAYVDLLAAIFCSLIFIIVRLPSHAL